MNAKKLLGGLIAAAFAVGASAQSGTGTFIEQPAANQQAEPQQLESGSQSGSTDANMGYTGTDASGSYSSVTSSDSDMHKPAGGDERLEKGPISDGELTVWWPGMDAAADNAAEGQLQQ
jgi:hypothetical protein